MMKAPLFPWDHWDSQYHKKKKKKELTVHHTWEKRIDSSPYRKKKELSVHI